MANYIALCNSTGTIAWRVWPVQRALGELGHNVRYINKLKVTDEQFEELLDWADVITFQMIATKELLEEAKKRNIYTIFDCDDLIDEVPERHPQYEMTNDKEYQKLFRRVIKNVDMVTVSTPVLYEHYRKYNSNITVLPNRLPDYFWERPLRSNASKQLRIGFAGGTTHIEDLEYIAPMIKEVTREFDAKFIYTGGGGWSSGLPTTFKFGEDLFKDLPYQYKEFNPGEKIHLWPDRLNSMRLDIALAPVVENNFSRCKSDIKYFEYSINHWPGVYQEFLYKNVVKHGETGFLATTPEDWDKYVRLLINDDKLRKRIGENAYRDVKNNYTFGTGTDWLDVYRSASQKRNRTSDSFLVKSV